MRRLVTVGLLSIGLLAGCSGAANDRATKDAQSDQQGGLDRIAKIYDYNGHLLATYEGRFDLDPNTEAGNVKFDLNGKRHIIKNAIAIIDEK